MRSELEGLTIELGVRAGETGKLFGAVTPADVIGAIKKAGGPSVDKRAVQIGKPIKTVGATRSASSCTTRSPPTYRSPSSQRPDLSTATAAVLAASP